MAVMLGTILQKELAAANDARRAERLQAEALTDSMTGLHNRRAWDRLLETENERCRRYGHPATVMMVDLDELKSINDKEGHAAGDDLIIRAGTALHQAMRSLDIVARLGGDEFGILAIECDRNGCSMLLERARKSLALAGVRASIGYAILEHSESLKAACARADRMMYECKRSTRHMTP